MRALEAGQIRVKVEASGLCHTDIHAAHGDWPVKPTPPFIPGHEGVGIVTELGAGVSEVALGDRVAMPWLGYACGICDHCVSGWETLCLEQKNMGYSIDGGLGEYATAYARYVVEVPQGIDPLDAAPLTCAGVTTYKAVKVAGTRSSDLVAVFGVGGLGHLAIQYAAIAGGRVVAVDIVDEKLELARELGAEFTVNAAKEDPVAAIQALGGVDQAIALAVSPRAFEQAFGSLRRHGTLVFVALPADNAVTLPIFETVLGGITITGSIVGTRTDLREVFELHAAGKTKVIREVRGWRRSTSRSPTSKLGASPRASCSDSDADPRRARCVAAAIIHRDRTEDARKERRMTLLPRAPIDLLLAPVAVHLDMNLARLREMSPAEIDFQIALALDRPERTGTAEERMERLVAVTVRNVELHGWTPTITDDHCRHAPERRVGVDRPRVERTDDALHRRRPLTSVQTAP